IVLSFIQPSVPSDSLIFFQSCTELTTFTSFPACAIPNLWLLVSGASFIGSEDTIIPESCDLKEFKEKKAQTKQKKNKRTTGNRDFLITFGGATERTCQAIKNSRIQKKIRLKIIQVLILKK